MMHRCGQCAANFEISSSTLLETGWGRRKWTEQLRDRIGFSQSLDDYERLKCPYCGNIENDERVGVFGVLRARTFVWLVIALWGGFMIYAFLNQTRWRP